MSDKSLFSIFGSSVSTLHFSQGARFPPTPGWQVQIVHTMGYQVVETAAKTTCLMDFCLYMRSTNSKTPVLFNNIPFIILKVEPSLFHKFNTFAICTWRLWPFNCLKSYLYASWEWLFVCKLRIVICMHVENFSQL